MLRAQHTIPPAWLACHAMLRRALLLPLRLLLPLAGWTLMAAAVCSALRCLLQQHLAQGLRIHQATAFKAARVPGRRGVWRLRGLGGLGGLNGRVQGYRVQGRLGKGGGGLLGGGLLQLLRGGL